MCVNDSGKTHFALSRTPVEWVHGDVLEVSEVTVTINQTKTHTSYRFVSVSSVADGVAHLCNYEINSLSIISQRYLWIWALIG